MIGSALFVVAALAVAQGAPEAQAERDWLKVTARAQLPDAGQVGVGEPFRFVIEAEHAPGGVALLPESLTLDPHFSERKSERRHVRSGSGKTEIDRYELELLPFDSGDLEVPKIPLAYGSTVASTPIVPITVKTGFDEKELPVASSTRAEAMEELEKMAATDPSPVAVLVDDYTLLWAAGIALVAGALAFFAWRWHRARKLRLEAVAAEVVPPPRPAHEVAIEQLRALRRAGLLEKGELKPFFAAVSEILRAYVGGRYGFDSLDLTVDELVLELTKVSTPGLDVAALRRTLDAADLVKFAKFTPDLTEAAQAIATAESIVDRTKPAAADASAAPPPSTAADEAPTDPRVRTAPRSGGDRSGGDA